MRLGFSKKDNIRPRHLVLAMDRFESFNVQSIITKEILNGVHPVIDYDNQRNIFLYRFALRYLDKLLLCFPQAQLSPALDHHLVIEQKKELDTIPIPDIEVSGFYDYLYEKIASLWDFQKVGIDNIEREIQEISENLMMQPHFILGDEIGLGKTLQAVGTARRNQWFPCLYVAPNSGKWSTKRIIDRFFDDDFSYQVVDGTRADRAKQIDSGADIIITNVETIRVKREYNRSSREWTYDHANPEFFFTQDGERRVWTYEIQDEIHRCKNPTAQQTHGFFDLQAERWLLMSGTWIINRVEEVWPSLHKMDPERFPTYYGFIQEFCISNPSGQGIAGYKPERIQWLKEYLKPRYLRRRREHVEKDLPEVVYVTRDIELTKEQRRLYTKIEEELQLEFENATNQKIWNPMTRTLRLKQACFSPELYGGSKNSAKLVAVKEDVEELVRSGEKAILFSQWSRATRILHREFADYNPAYVDGSIKGKHRSAQEDKFNLDPDCKLYIGTIGANREAITLNAATYVLFLDKDWSPQYNKQAAGRSAAGGLRGVDLPKGKKVHIIEYLARDTVEEYIEELLAKKQRIFDSFIESDGGARFPKLTVGDVKNLLGMNRKEAA